MYRCFYPRTDVDRLHWKRKNGIKGLISLEECIATEKTSLDFYLKKQKRLLTEVVIEGVISDDEKHKDVKMQLLQQRKENHPQKRMHSRFMRGTEEVSDDNNSWTTIKDI